MPGDATLSRVVLSAQMKAVDVTTTASTSTLMTVRARRGRGAPCTRANGGAAPEGGDGWGQARRRQTPHRLRWRRSAGLTLGRQPGCGPQGWRRVGQARRRQTPHRLRWRRSAGLTLGRDRGCGPQGWRRVGQAQRSHRPRLLVHRSLRRHRRISLTVRRDPGSGLRCLPPFLPHCRLGSTRRHDGFRHVPARSLPSFQGLGHCGDAVARRLGQLLHRQAVLGLQLP